ncbi:hypothetical protein [Streptomyces sp900129855]|uniref:Uncharacterized protein n=1 Tax=Streptomyces sp. 900129855 TaxID=3155129 RepID=A0ABV2ZT95_9ACTN
MVPGGFLLAVRGEQARRRLLSSRVQQGAGDIAEAAACSGAGAFAPRFTEVTGVTGVTEVTGVTGVTEVTGVTGVSPGGYPQIGCLAGGFAAGMVAGRGTASGARRVGNAATRRRVARVPSGTWTAEPLITEVGGAGHRPAIGQAGPLRNDPAASVDRTSRWTQ